MFQSFEVKTEPGNGSKRVARLRELLQKYNLGGFIVPLTDEYQNEYTAPYAERLSWLTGFTGSAGVALILKKKAVIFTDGRYTIQVRQQTDPLIFSYEDSTKNPLLSWLVANKSDLIDQGSQRIGFDPWLHSIQNVEQLRKCIEGELGGDLVAVKHNLVDEIWVDQPSPPLQPVSIQPLEYAGKSAEEKILEINKCIGDHDSDVTIFTCPASIAWLFNIRGKDVLHTPLALCFCIFQKDKKPTLFIDERKLSGDVLAYLNNCTKIKSPAEFLKEVKTLAGDQIIFGLDSRLVADIIRTTILENGGRITELADPITLMRAVKNQAEVNGARAAHLRDGVALVRFFCWLDQQPPGSISEIQAAETLERFRATTAEDFSTVLEDLSFDTISGSGPNGAIVHYRVTTESNRMLGDGELYLVDSGAQYQDGTTDVTRTVPIGKIGETEKYCFTLVLKGTIRLALARFPKGTRGCDLDVLARNALWNAGFDYAHGTGHGVGSYLAVHEGPQSISRYGAQELVPGMLVSDEPGYYRQGAFGIRIENVVHVHEARPITDGELKMMGFETLTLCPIDNRLIMAEYLSSEELDWLNNYHGNVWKALAPFLDEREKEWLKNATRPL